MMSLDRTFMIEETIKQLKEVENIFYNAFEGNIFEIAAYLYLRYGELPQELDNEEKLYKLGNILNEYESCQFNEDLNAEVTKLMNKESEENV